MDKRAHELSSGASHLADNTVKTICGGTIKVSRDTDVLLWRSWVQVQSHVLIGTGLDQS